MLIRPHPLSLHENVDGSRRAHEARLDITGRTRFNGGVPEESRQRSRLARFFCPRMEEASAKSLVIFLVCLALLGVAAIGWGVAGARAQHTSASWPSAQAEVTRCEITDDGLQFEYRFEGDGRNVVADTRRLARMSVYHWWDDRSGFVERHPPGSTITVWYDPGDPRRATISQGVSWLDVVFPALALVALATGAMPTIRELRRRDVEGKGPLL